MNLDPENIKINFKLFLKVATNIQKPKIEALLNLLLDNNNKLSAIMTSKQKETNSVICLMKTRHAIDQFSIQIGNYFSWVIHDAKNSKKFVTILSNISTNQLATAPIARIQKQSVKIDEMGKEAGDVYCESFINKHQAALRKMEKKLSSLFEIV